MADRVHILAVDDEQDIREILRILLESRGYAVACAANGDEAVSYMEQHPETDLVIMDIMMPELDGFSACREIKKSSNIPIIMLSARGEEYDRINGFELGVDDYVVKPFETKEIVARIKAVMRRTGKTSSENDIKEVSYDKLVVNMTKYELKVDGKVVDTPPKELELLYHLASNPNRVYTRNQLLDEVWGFDYFGDSRTVDVHIKRLREKLEGVSDQWRLKTVWGVGYKFEIGPAIPS